jgi:membrane-bound metal-dependent hydrolase YbcI (DUF457 family)
MLGRDHALSGAFAFAALAPVLHVTGADLATGVALGAGAGLLPDIDHPDSSVALSFGFLTNSFSWLVGKISGGHRHGTHAFIGVTIFTVGAYFAGKYQLSGPHPPYPTPGTPAWHPALFLHLVPVGLFLSLLYSAALRALKIGGHHGDLIAMAGAGATIYYGTDLITVTPWHVPLLAFVTALGCAAHIAGDELTHSGCPLLYPLSKHEFHLLPRPVEITTGKIAETYAVFPILAIALAAALWHATGHKI